MENKSYCDILTFFKDEGQRTVEHLAAKYKDRELIAESIEKLLGAHFSKDAVAGKKVLLKPNLVLEWQKPDDEICLCTNERIILATMEFFLRLSPKSLIVGDAPIQGCVWDKVLTDNFHKEFEALKEQYGIPIKLVDFRRVTFDKINNVLEVDRSTLDDYLIFDLGEKSYLEEITTEENTMRVTDYNPDRMKLAHSKGVHKYCIRKDVIDSDIVVTIPKTKTHRMAGMTNSLKILVGINGDKDFLPHHRLGPVSGGGDCYKDKSVLRSIAEKIFDFANRNRGKFLYRPTYVFGKVLWKLSRPNKETSMNAGWYGNDTVWRMVMDLNMIATYGKTDGTLSDQPQRTMYTLCDGIIAGQCEGPLCPSPLALGTLTFSNDPYLSDEVAGHLYRLNLSKIPTLRESEELNKQKVCEITIDGKKATLKDVDNISTNVIMSAGWINYNK